MVRKSLMHLSLTVLALLVLMPAMALAQSSIAGIVKDATRAVLPGVTVEAASPALIEKVRTVVTDDQGLYKIIDLRPGVYDVTFTLPSFSTVRHEGIELSASFTASVNAELKVGTLAETVTVSGQSPVVDVQNVVQQRVLTAEVVTVLPTARTFQSLAATIPGIRTVASRPIVQDVGGSADDRNATMGIHGGRPGDMQIMFEGMLFNNINTVAQTGIFVDMGSVQEVSYELSATSAQNQTGGIQVNVIPKEGGNRFQGSFFGAFTNHKLQSDNVTDELRARGLQAGSITDKVWDVDASFGGPLKQDKLWFFGSFRYWGTNDRVAGMYYNRNPTAFVWTPDFDLSRPLIDDSSRKAGAVRLTWQAAQKHKVNVFAMEVARTISHSSVGAGAPPISPEATQVTPFPRNHFVQVGWSAPLTNRLLLDAGVLILTLGQAYLPQPGTEEFLPITELSTGVKYRSSIGGRFFVEEYAYNYRGALSYVTGSHAFKFGFYLRQGDVENSSWRRGDMTLQLLNGVPRQVTIYTTPFRYQRDLNAALGIFAQDQWTVKRLTLNAGLRYDHHNSSLPELHLPPAQFVGARDFAAIEGVPNWHDLSPRLGASYDLFGNGKTALKVSLSRYVQGEALGFAGANNPVTASVNQATRTWTDLNGNQLPDCDFVNPEPNNECGVISNRNFGKPVIVNRYDDDVRDGFGKRGYNWETSAGVQHELMANVSMNATYFRRWFGNALVIDNLLVNPSDYDTFCITAPVDARLPGGGGNQLCGLYDINPARFGRVDNLFTFAKNFGTQTEVYNGVDLTVNARLPRGMLLSGGLNVGRLLFDNCDVIGKVDNPAQSPGGASVGDRGDYSTVASPSTLYCHQEPPFQPQVRLLGSVPLPWGFQASGTFQTLPGPQIAASWAAPNALIAPSLGRNLSSGVRGTATAELIAPGTLYENRVYQVDARLSKVFRIGGTRIQANFDLYNLFNASPVLVRNNVYGALWGRPSYVLPGRLLKFGGQLDF